MDRVRKKKMIKKSKTHARERVRKKIDMVRVRKRE